MRKPLQGVRNIVRFNWHYYAIAAAFITIALLLRPYLDDMWSLAAIIAVAVVVLSMFISLLVSAYIYDFSSLYKLSWLRGVQPVDGNILNINAGFDETSELLVRQFPNAILTAADFYDPAKHTEVSIKRARKAQPPFPGTITVSTAQLSLPGHLFKHIFLILAAHEIRDPKERANFFRSLKQHLEPSGQIIVTEHLRDLPNFLAYNIGFFHFHSRLAWLKTFNRAGLRVSKEFKITPFLSTFVVEKNGTAP